MLKKIFKIIVLISFIPYIIVIYNIIRSYFTGVAYEYLISSSFSFEKEIESVINYLKYCFSTSYFGTLTFPIVIVCLILQIVYLCMKSSKK